MQLQLNVTIDVISDYMELNVPEDFQTNYHGEAKTAVVKETEAAIEDALSKSGVIGSVVNVSVDDHIFSEEEQTMMTTYWQEKDSLDNKRRHWLDAAKDAFVITFAEWSMFEVFRDGEHTFDWMLPIHRHHDEPTVFISSNSWGKKYTSGVYENPTLKDLFIEADRSISGTGDHHHIYLEGTKVKRNTETDQIEIHMWFGS